MLQIDNIKAALDVIAGLGLPRAQQNERSALCLLALLDLPPGRSWAMAKNPMIGITPIMDWAAKNYKKQYAPNSRETFRRFSMHQFVQAGFVIPNPDDPARPINSPKTVYQIEAETLDLLKKLHTSEWEQSLELFLAGRQTLVARYAKERRQNQIPLVIAEGKAVALTPGEHSLLIKSIVEEFAPRFAPGGTLVYLGDTGNKWSHVESSLLNELGINIDTHGKMPDVVIYMPDKQWLLLIEAVTSHGPVDAKRHAELAAIFSSSKAGLVYVTAFPSRKLLAKYIGEIAWETEVWTADNPSHIIHFNGERFLGPY